MEQEYKAILFSSLGLQIFQCKNSSLKLNQTKIILCKQPSLISALEGHQNFTEIQVTPTSDLHEATTQSDCKQGQFFLRKVSVSVFLVFQVQGFSVPRVSVSSRSSMFYDSGCSSDRESNWNTLTYFRHVKLVKLLLIFSFYNSGMSG